MLMIYVIWPLLVLQLSYLLMMLSCILCLIVLCLQIPCNLVYQPSVFGQTIDSWSYLHRNVVFCILLRVVQETCVQILFTALASLFYHVLAVKVIWEFPTIIS